MGKSQQPPSAKTTPIVSREPEQEIDTSDELALQSKIEDELPDLQLALEQDTLTAQQPGMESSSLPNDWQDFEPQDWDDTDLFD